MYFVYINPNMNMPTHIQLMIMAYNLPNTNTTSYAASSFHGDEASIGGFDEFFEFDDWFGSDISTFPSWVDGLQCANLMSDDVCADSGRVTETVIENYRKNRGEKKERSEKVAFRTKSEIEVLDDGFRWRKYGKKKVKNSPNPRNYYKCAVESCTVKKRVERDSEDRRYIITTYEGIHNHEGSKI